MANVIARAQKPTLVIAHNKTLAAQLCNEFREFLPDNAVEYFVSYYDYYQPEAYLPARTCTSRRTRRSTTRSTACATPRPRPAHAPRRGHRRQRVLHLRPGLARGLPATAWCCCRTGDDDRPRRGAAQAGGHPVRSATTSSPARGKFRVRGDSLEIWPADEDNAVRVELWGDEVEQIVTLRPAHRRGARPAAARRHLSGHPLRHHRRRPSSGRWSRSQRELEERCAWFEEHGKLLEAHRLRQRTQYDMEMLREMGFCNGIENYSRILLGKAARAPRPTAARLLPGRLPLLHRRVAHDACPRSAACTRATARASTRWSTTASACRAPSTTGRCVRRVPRQGAADRVRAAPPRASSSWRNSVNVVEQIIRPTGLVDPAVEVRPTERPDRRPHERDPPARRARTSGRWSRP